MLLDSRAILQGFKLSMRHEPATHHDSIYLVNAAKQLKTIPRIVWHCTTVFPIPVTNSDRLAGCLTSEQMIPPLYSVHHQSVVQTSSQCSCPRGVYQ
jgi:hypothetical protein